MNADLCRGPFDVVVERRTVQLFPEPDGIDALQQLVTRLGRRGVFVSQQHFGWWKPGQPINHYGEEWLKAEGFVIMRKASETDLIDAERLARLKLSTG